MEIAIWIGVVLAVGFLALVAGFIVRSLFASGGTPRKNSVAGSVAFLAAESKRRKDAAKAERIEKQVMAAVDLAIAQADAAPSVLPAAAATGAPSAPASSPAALSPQPPPGVAASY